MTPTADTRPKILVIHQLPGIGDLVWYVGYFRAIAAQSRGGQITVLARPSTHAKALLSVEPAVSEVIEYDRRPRRSEHRRGIHDGLLGLRRVAQILKEREFDRVYMFSDRARHGLLAWLAHIPLRAGYGYHLAQRLFLNEGPYIHPYQGTAVKSFHEATEFARAHGFTTGPIVPRLTVPETLLAQGQAWWQDLPNPRYALIIGSSEPHKQWGAENFIELSLALLKQGCGITLIGGPGEHSLAERIVAGLPVSEQAKVRLGTRNTILQTAAILATSDVCVGNDTGALNMAAACARPTFCLLGPRKLLDHDPMLVCLRSPTLVGLTPENVLSALRAAHVAGSEPV